MFVPSTKRFETNPYTMNYERRFLINNKVFRVSITPDNWDKNNTIKQITKWFQKYNLTDRSFPYGKLDEEIHTNYRDVEHCCCEYCGKLYKTIKTKRYHMEKCKFKPAKETETEPLHTTELDNETETDTATEPVPNRSKEGHIYIVQPKILNGTNKYKIGSSRSPLKRIKAGYGSKTNVICVFKVPDQFRVETFILREITKEYPPIQGREWFECKPDVLFDKVIEAYMEYKLTLNSE
jgi:hypothetical protein